jgi:hypothetical protein
MERIDWTDCALVEIVPGKRGGKLVIKGTRLRPKDLLANREQGIEWLVENHGESRQIRFARCSILYDRHRRAPPRPSGYDPEFFPC